METYSYQEILNRKLIARKKINKAYSLRAYSRDLGIAPQTISLILSGKRKLPERYVDSIVEKLNLNFREELLFRQSIANERGSLEKLRKVIPNNQNIIHEEINHKLVSDWEYYAIYTLLETNKRFSSSKEIANELNLDCNLVEMILKELQEFALIKFEEGQYVQTSGELNTSWDIPSRTLRQAQKNNMDLAKEKIDLLPLSKKQFSSATLPICEDKVDEVKKMIQEFQNKLSKYVRNDKADSVYQLNLQFFSLTNNTNEELNQNENK